MNIQYAVIVRLVLTVCVVAASGCVVQVDEVAAPRVPISVASGGVGGGTGFAATVQPTMLEFCGLCHNASSATGGVDLSGYTAMLSSGVVIGGDPDRSTVVAMLESGAMPPPGNAKPSEEQIAAVRAWIVAGAQDD